MSQASADLFRANINDKLAVKVDPSWFKSVYKNYSNSPQELYSLMQNALRNRLGNQRISKIRQKAEAAMETHRTLPKKLIQDGTDRKIKLISDSLPFEHPDLWDTELFYHVPVEGIKPVSVLAGEAVAAGKSRGSDAFYKYIADQRAPYLQGPQDKLPELLSNAEINRRLTDIFR